MMHQRLFLLISVLVLFNGGLYSAPLEAAIGGNDDSSTSNVTDTSVASNNTTSSVASVSTAIPTLGAASVSPARAGGLSAASVNGNFNDRFNRPNYDDYGGPGGNQNDRYDGFDSYGPPGGRDNFFDQDYDNYGPSGGRDDFFDQDYDNYGPPRGRDDFFDQGYDDYGPPRGRNDFSDDRPDSYRSRGGQNDFFDQPDPYDLDSPRSRYDDSYGSSRGRRGVNSDQDFGYDHELIFRNYGDIAGPGPLPWVNRNRLERNDRENPYRDNFIDDALTDQDFERILGKFNHDNLFRNRQPDEPFNIDALIDEEYFDLPNNARKYFGPFDEEDRFRPGRYGNLQSNNNDRGRNYGNDDWLYDDFGSGNNNNGRYRDSDLGNNDDWRYDDFGSGNNNNGRYRDNGNRPFNDNWSNDYSGDNSNYDTGSFFDNNYNGFDNLDNNNDWSYDDGFNSYNNNNNNNNNNGWNYGRGGNFNNDDWNYGNVDNFNNNNNNNYNNNGNWNNPPY